MITIKASQKIFTYAEVANLTGICAEHLHNLAKRQRLGFFASAAESLGNQVEHWFFTPWDLMVLTTLFPRCATKVAFSLLHWRELFGPRRPSWSAALERNRADRRRIMTSKFLLASDFDQTLSFNDSGVVLSELIGFHSFHDKVKGLADINLVQQGAQLSYLILHDPDFRRVRLEHLVETGRRIRLKHDVALFARVLDNLGEEHKFNFNVISAAPQEIVQSALEGIVPPDHIFGTR